MRTFLAAAVIVCAASVCAPGVHALAQSKPSSKSKSTTKRKTVKKRSAARRPPPVSAKQKAASSAAVETHLRSSVDFGIQNPAALIPFFETVYRHREGAPGPVRILHFGDSHTASDDWPGALRARFQSEFGNGGAGFVQAGRPFPGFRRLDAKSSMSRGWEPDGLLSRNNDGLNGLAGVSLRASRAGETLSLESEGERLQLLYWKQPGGGRAELEIDGQVTETIDTAGDAAAGFIERTLPRGLHKFTLRTLSDAEVRVFGWVVENASGITWETLGINGAQADLVLSWDQELLRSHIESRDPALIVVAYGSNEARRKDWTEETYREAFTGLLKRLRQAAPTASLLVVGPPDQSMRRGGRWTPLDGVDAILSAQRDAAEAAGAAFWNLRSSMGGKGSMKQWVYAGLAQGDFVHFTSPGYRLLGESLYGLMMDTYSVFTTFRRQATGNNFHGSSSQNR